MQRSIPIFVFTISCAMQSAMIQAEEHHAHWGYSGHEDPSHWGELDDSYHVCADGRNQSPIDIHDALKTTLPPLDIHYTIGGFDEINNGHTIQMQYAEGSWITLQNKDYQLKQFHFHAPSENTIEGQQFPMEAHFVHVADDGAIAVLAVMFEEGAANAALDEEAWRALPKHAGDHHAMAHLFQANDLLPEDRSYYRFNGSLTTPPCTEGVTWMVLKQPVALSKEQIAAFETVMGEPNNRPVQPLNARVVLQ
jgi:carbonic anhydrase